ncbi:aKG-HExxH-type peptide beta-hydroxylase [Streptomyces sp. Da 82-17]|uniref:aKG-HExxH-type peptide beta-hydroxylase n=1 Tax=Streptomyces sp. Da 82-17 TaxID=3377116 RepID=UPI0038D4D7BF
MISDMQPVLRDVLPAAAAYPVPVIDGPSHEGLRNAFLKGIAEEASVDYDIFRDQQVFGADELELKRGRITAALDVIGENWPEFRALYELLVPVLLYAPDGGLAGGTSSTVLGVLWLAPKEHWNSIDVQEFLLHEFIHHTLFLEERRFGFYRNMDMLMEDRYLTRSAIRKDRRPLDKVLHSIVVGMEVLLARQENRVPGYDTSELSLHPQSGELRDGVAASLDEVFELPLEKLLQPRPIEILELCRKRLTDITS